MFLISRRFISSLVGKPNNVSLPVLQNKLKQSTHTQDDLALLVTALIGSENQTKDQLINEIFDNVDSFSIYFKLPEVSKLPLDSQLRLMDLNPGRVLLSQELSQKFARDHPSLKLKLLEKVIRGENYEAVEFEMGLEELLETLEQMKGGESKFAVSPDLVEDVILKLDKMNAISILDHMSKVCDLPSDLIVDILHKHVLNPYTYLKLFSYVEPSGLGTIDDYFHAINILNTRAQELATISDKEEATAKSLGITYEQVNSSVIVTAVESKELESVAIRLLLMKYLAFRANDFPKLLAKYHYYSTHAKDQFHILQNQLVVIYAYHVVDTQLEINLKIMNSLITEEITVSQLQLMIIANAVFDADNLIQVFNDYIPQLSTNVSDKTQRSPSGRVTEALVIAFLLRNDREFAHLVLEKLAMNGKVGDMEVTQIKRHLKAWGDSFVDSDEWADAEPIFRKHVLQFLETL